MESAKETPSICSFSPRNPTVADVQDQDTTATTPASSSDESQDQRDNEVSGSYTDQQQEFKDSASASSTLAGDQATEIQDEAIQFHRLGSSATISNRLHYVQFNAKGVLLDTRKSAFITALHVPPLSQGNEKSKGLHPPTH